MKRKIIALCLVVAMLGVAVISGTMAYFTDTAEAVNVMTIGSVKIEQNEQQRAADGKTLEAFVQGKELIPAVGPVAKYIDLDGNETDSYESAYKFLAKADFTALPNAIDKIVTVENTGRSDAYVRTIFAFEVVESAAELYGTDEDVKTIKFMRNDKSNNDNDDTTLGNSDWTWEWFNEVITVGGQKYAIAVATHEAILAPKAETIPSLLQIYLKSNVEQEYAAKLGDTYDVLAISQGVQASGFSDSVTALNEAFGAITYDATTGTYKNLPWNVVLDTNMVYDSPVTLSHKSITAAKTDSISSSIAMDFTDGLIADNITVNTTDYRYALHVRGGEAIISNSSSNAVNGIAYYATSGANLTLNDCVGTRSTIGDPVWANSAVAAAYGATLTINGGEYTSDAYGVYVFNSGANVVIKDGTFKAPVVLKADGSYTDTSVKGVITVNGGSFDGKIEMNNGYAAMTINGGTFTNFSVATYSPLVITGGTFDADPAKYVDTAAYTVTNNGNGTWTVNAASN